MQVNKKKSYNITLRTYEERMLPGLPIKQQTLFLEPVNRLPEQYPLFRVSEEGGRKPLTE